MKMKLSDNPAFHKQSLQMMGKGVLMFQAGGSQLFVEKANLTKFTTRKCHPEELKICWKAYSYRNTDIEGYVKQTILPNQTA